MLVLLHMEQSGALTSNPTIFSSFKMPFSKLLRRPGRHTAKSRLAERAPGTALGGNYLKHKKLGTGSFSIV